MVAFFTGRWYQFRPILKIFDKFYRVTTTKTKETRGSGLGLTLAKHIIEAHGGTIEVESEVGKGSKFTIRIPLL